MLFSPTLTGVVRPLVSKEISGEIPLSSSWILGIIGLLFLIFIIFSFKKMHKEKSEIEKCIEIIEPYISEALQKGYSKEKIKELLIKEGWSDKIMESLIEEIKLSSKSSDIGK